MIEISNHIKKDGTLDKFLRIFFSSCFTIFNFFKKKQIDNQKILIISLHKLGDTVFTIPAIKALKKELYPEITIACFDDSRKIYELVFDSFNYIILRKEDFLFSGRIAKSSSRKKIKNTKAETIIDLTGAVNSASLIFNNYAKRIIGFNEKYFQKIYSDFIPKRKNPHLMDLYLDVAKILIKIEDESELKKFEKSEKQGEYILIHPFAGWKAKEWNLHKFVELAEQLKKKYKCKFIIPADRADVETLSLINTKNISYKISSDISELIEAVKNASVVIGCDSGAVYIASILGKFTFSIYGPTNPRFSMPFGAHNNYIQQEVNCSPKFNEQYCYLDAGRKCQTINCMKTLSVKEVLSQIYSFFENTSLQEFSKTEKGASY